MSTDINAKYPWVPFYEAVADKLLEYKSRDGRKELSKIMADIADEVGVKGGINLFKIRPNFNKDNKDMSEELITLNDVSPYTIFFYLNSNSTDANRAKIASLIGDKLGIPQSIERPTSFTALPRMQLVNPGNLRWNCGPNWVNSAEESKHKDIIWKQYELAIRYADGDVSVLDELKTYFNQIISWKGVCNGLTKGMFYIRPDSYMTMDKNSRKYISDYLQLNISKSTLSADDYFILLKELKRRFNDQSCPVHSFVEISYISFQDSTKNAANSYDDDVQNYWLVGHKFNNGSEEQIDRFTDDGIWEGGVKISDISQVNCMKKIRKNDILVLKTPFFSTKPRKLLIDAVCVVKDNPTVHEDDESVSICCDVDYFDNIENKEFVIEKGTSQINTTVAALKNDEIIKWLKEILNSSKESTNENMIKKYSEFLKRSRNLILTGAPGTGKTYLAKQIAQAMNEGLKTEDRKNTVGFVQFHPSYDYVDFVEGLRPDRSGDNVVFKRDDGIFKKFCKKAIKDHEHNYVFIIDEINRGDLSKIFGELFFAIDPGYRGEKGRVKTQYQQLVDAEEDDVFSGEGFYVPDNVYIIGTMNDIDRSVENMDFALRRRFAWKKISPEDTAESMGITGEVRQRMDAMNKAICSIPELGEDYQIGGAYFLKLKDENLTAEELWQFHLESLIGEYLRGLPNNDELYKKIKDAYDNPNKEAKTSENPAED